jgi:hypothetical protein
MECIDQDLFGYIIDFNGTPSISGCLLYHGDWHERTEIIQTPYNGKDNKSAIEYLRNNFKNRSGTLNDLGKSETDAFKKINQYVQEEKKSNPNFK